MFRIQTLIPVLLLSLSLLTSVVPISFAQASHPAEFPDVVASVNGQAITRAELLTQGALMRSQLRKAEGVAPKPDLEFYRGVLDGLIGEVLIFDDGSRRGVEATDQEVERALQGLREKHPSDEAFQASLVEQGTSVLQVRDQLYRSLSLEKIMRQEIGAKSLVEDAEAKQFYDQNQHLMRLPEAARVRHILVRADKNDPESVRKARQTLGEYRRQIEKGRDFGEVARQFSEDSATRDSGGLLPWVPITESEADQRLAALKVGEVSQIEETQHGYHLIQVMEKRPSQLAPFEEVKARIIYMLETSRMRLAVQERVEALRKTAKVEIYI